MEFSFGNSSLLVINSYFPCDPQTHNFNDQELVQLLADIEVMLAHSTQSSILLSGDLNCDFSRNNSFTNIVRNFFEEKGLKILWLANEDNISPVDYTHMSDTNGTISVSTIDHFVTDASTFKSLKEAGVIHSHLNTSNHSAIYTKLDIREFQDRQCQGNDISSDQRVKWETLTEEDKIR